MNSILTPTGYKDISRCHVGDQVCAFDVMTGAPIINVIETMQWVDAAEWARWWQVEPSVPPFRFIRINGTWTLNSEQSIWRNAANVCHARDLVIGDVIFDDADRSVTITGIEDASCDGWWRFDISGDHSYIVDGLTLHNASRFWVLGTASWTAVNTANWAASTGGAGGVSVPGAADIVTFDGASGGGTVTVNFGGTITVVQLICGAFTGTLDFSVNNNSVTLSTSFLGNGSGTRTINLGNGTWTLSASASGTIWNMSTTTGLTFAANSSTITCTGLTANLRTFQGGSLTYSTVLFPANSSGGGLNITGANTISVLTVTGPNYLQFPAGTATAVTTLSLNGSSGSPVGLQSGVLSTSTTISVAINAPAMTWASFRDIACTGGATFAASNSFNDGGNSGIAITAPAVGGASGGFIIGD